VIKVKVKVASLVLSVLLAMVFLAAGLLKILSSDKMVAIFSELGAGQWFRYVIGIAEIGIAVVLFIPSYRATASFLAAFLMMGAIASHAFFISGSALPAVVLFIVASLIIWFEIAHSMNKSGVNNE